MSPVSGILLFSMLFLFGKVATEVYLLGNRWATFFGLRIGLFLASGTGTKHLFDKTSNAGFFGFRLFLVRHIKIIKGLAHVVKFSMLVYTALICELYSVLASNGMGEWILERLGE